MNCYFLLCASLYRLKYHQPKALGQALHIVLASEPHDLYPGGWRHWHKHPPAPQAPLSGRLTHSSSDTSPMSLWDRFSSFMMHVTTCGVGGIRD